MIKGRTSKGRLFDPLWGAGKGTARGYSKHVIVYFRKLEGVWSSP